MFKNKRHDIINKIIEENIDYLFRFAFFRIGNREEAEDVVYEAVLKFLEKSPKDIKTEGVRLYLFRIVCNLCADKERFPERDLRLNDNFEIEDSSISSFELEDFERIDSCLQKIESNEAEIIRMKVIDEFSFVEISKILSIPESTVKSRFKAGLVKLRKLFDIKKMS